MNADAAFAQHTAERCSAAPESHRLSPPPAARPFGEAYERLISAEQSALIDALIEHAIGPAADLLLERIDARLELHEERMLALLALAARDHGRPQPRRPDSPPVETPPVPEDDPPEPQGEPGSDPGPAQVPPAEGDCECEGWGCPRCTPGVDARDDPPAGVLGVPAHVRAGYDRAPCPDCGAFTFVSFRGRSACESCGKRT